MVKINVVGEIFGTSGYSMHTRNLFNALYELTPHIHLDVPKVPAWEAQVNDAELNCMTKTHFDDGIMIMIGQPPFWTAGMVEKNKAFVGCCVWEGDRVPQRFMKNILKADRVICPSAHVKAAILTTAGTEVGIAGKDVTIIPHGVDTNLFKPREDKPETFTFICNKGWSRGMQDRGGVQYVLKAFVEEFGEEEDVHLRLKINTAYASPGWNLNEELKKIGIPDLGENKPRRIYIGTNSVEYNAIPRTYNGHCFVNASMAEGFNIPCLEAMSCGMPVITPWFGGHADFVNNKNGWHIDCSLFENVWDWEYEGVQWAMPDLEDLKKKMRHAYENPDVVAIKGEEARKTAEAYTWKKAAQQVYDLCKELEGKP